MKLPRNVAFSTLLFLIVSIWGFSVVLKAENSQSNYFSGGDEDAVSSEDENIIFFYSSGCAHCAKVEKYMEENNVSEKIDLESREVSGSEENAELFVEKVRACGMSTEQLYVPFLWDGEKCYQGDSPIIEFLKNKINED